MATTPTAASQVSLGFDSDLHTSFSGSGVVSSDNSGCVAGRTVDLFRKRAHKTGFIKLGTDTTDPSGNYSIDFTVPAGHTYKVHAKVLESKIVGAVCGKDASPTESATGQA